MDRWFAVSRAYEVDGRHIVQTQLLGQELVLWRDVCGGINAWENRCPHRGVRLSIGFHTGMELRCQYHGWRFASGTGQCTAIPAHPTQKPAGTITARTFRRTLLLGYFWVSLGEPATSPLVPISGDKGWTTLRSVFINAPAEVLGEILREGYAVADDPPQPVEAIDMYTLRGAGIGFLIQPVDTCQVVLHSVLDHVVPEGERLAVLRRHNARIKALARRAESAR